ncbi:hypothetical protein LIA77_10684 [Sarocladium implicatum]|nr:hypothetical protein LIA77_10684 [Sarocladium implicatum]
MLGLSSAAAVLLALAPAAFAKPSLKKVLSAAVNLDLENRTDIAVPGGLKSGIDESSWGSGLTILSVTAKAQDESFFSATCGGYAWSTVYLADTDAQYAELDARMDCVTDDGVPFIAIETGAGTNTSNIMRRIQYEIGAPYEHLRSKFFLAEITQPPPNLEVDVYEVS